MIVGVDHHNTPELRATPGMDELNVGKLSDFIRDRASAFGGASLNDADPTLEVQIADYKVLILHNAICGRVHVDDHCSRK